jgi:hypothetical protein
MRSVLQLTLLMSSFAVVLPAQTPQSELETFLRKQLGATTYELNVLDKGGIVVKLPKTPETREVVAFAVMRLDVPPDFLIDRVRDITTLKKGDNVMQIGKFSNPPRPQDLAGLTLEPTDIEAIRLCKVNSCDVKMSRTFEEGFQPLLNRLGI